MTWPRRDWSLRRIMNGSCETCYFALNLMPLRTVPLCFTASDSSSDTPQARSCRGLRSGRLSSLPALLPSCFRAALSASAQSRCPETDTGSVLQGSRPECPPGFQSPLILITLQSNIWHNLHMLYHEKRVYGRMGTYPE